jgi:hypothetical protein
VPFNSWHPGTGGVRRNASAFAFFPGGYAAFLAQQESSPFRYLAELDPSGAPPA